MADVPPNPNSGAAGTEYQTIEALRRLGHSVHAVWRDELSHRIEHGNLHYLFELPASYRRTLREELRREKYDVVHVNQPHGFLAAKYVLSMDDGPVFIHRSHGLELRVERDLALWQEKYDSDGRSLSRRLVSRLVARGLRRNTIGIARYADGHIVSATACRDFLQNEVGVAEERIAVIPQAAPDSFTSVPTVSMSQERLKRVLYVGQYAFFKAPMVVADVMNRLSASQPMLEFTWVCSAADHQRVKALLSDDAKERVQLLNWTSQKELLEIYDRHGLFLFPSFFEGFGKVFLEAMSRGLCVVAADNSGAHDVIRNGVNGLLVQTGDSSSMADQCLDICCDFSRADAISKSALDTARSYSWDRVAQDTEAFYRARIEAKSRKAVRRVNPQESESFGVC